MPSSEPLVALERVNVHLNAHHVLKDVNWRLAPGEHWAFTGRNGSGKSTLLRVIRGDQWIDPDGGTRIYRFDGQTAEVPTARTRIGFVAPEQQEFYTRLELPIAGRAVVESGFDDSTYVHRGVSAEERARVDELLDRLHLHDLARKRVRALSFGQLRRLLIARALVRRPQLLVLDEFTNGLDRDARREVLALLDELAPEVQMVFASHRQEDFIGAVSHRAVMLRGRIADPDAPVAPRRRTRPVQPVRESVAQAPDGATPIVEVRRASVFRGTSLVLRDVDWSIRPGEHTAIVGPNGAGKSTFAGLVAGTLHPTERGEVLRFGRPGPFDLFRLKERIVHVSDDLQTIYTADASVVDVILSGFASSVGLVHEPSDGERATAEELIERLELDDLRGRRFRSLSFGERRKVLIARSLVRPPALFILDEVWNGLDSHFKDLLGGLLEELAAEGTTLLLIAHHDADLPALIRRTFGLSDGGLHAFPAHAQ